MSKRIMIDCRHICDRTGFSSYLKMILNAVNTVEEEFFLLVNNNAVDFYFDDYFTHNKNYKLIYAKSKPFSLSQNVEIPFLIKKNKITLFHSTNYDIPIFIFLNFGCKLVTTIHDIIPLKYTHVHKRSLIKRIYYWIMHIFATLLSDKILTVSEYSKKDIEEVLHVKPYKIDVIHSCFMGKVSPREYNICKENNEKVKLLFVGTNFKHKNIEILVKAVKLLADKNIDVKLNIVGAKTDYSEYLECLVKKFNIEEKVVIHGKITDEELSNMYKISDIYTFPSIVEGFGLPLLEAMSYGLPVISSNKTCMPEVVEDAGILVEPNAENFAQAVEYLINNPSIVQELIEKGYKRVQYFSQENFSIDLLKLYNIL